MTRAEQRHMERNEKILKFSEPQSHTGGGRESYVIFDFTIVDSWYMDTIKENKNTSYYRIYANLSRTTSSVLTNLINGELSDTVDGEVDAELIQGVLGRYLFHLFLRHVSDMLDSGEISTEEITLNAPRAEQEREEAKRLIRNYSLMPDPSNTEDREIIWVPDVHDIGE